MSKERGKHGRPEVVGTTKIENGLVLLLCWPDKHWIGEIRPGGVLRLYDRRCKTYVLFRLEELLMLLAAPSKRSAA
jgi:hypothetical protein